MKHAILGIVCLSLLAIGAAAAAVDMSGTWKGTTYIADRDAYDDLTIVLKKEATSYTGAVTDSLGMAQEAAIQNVTLEAEEIGFDFTIFDGQDYLTVHATAKVVDKKLVGKWAVVGSDSAGEFSLERVPEQK
ncbi:MAG: hypothetical protein OEW05_13335 [Candidatus Aminicenantes bacterium]|nr:hypothetical protein [Candidatus Aminicenantes bacterium]